MKIRSETEMMALGKALGRVLDPPMTVELIGDVGVGKTTLVKGIALGLGITEAITSPSFVIAKKYASKRPKKSASPKKKSAQTEPKEILDKAEPTETITLTHYDFYRLDEPGAMAEELTESIKDPNNLTVVEWSESVKAILPEKHVIVRISLLDDNSREVEIGREVVKIAGLAELIR